MVLVRYRLLDQQAQAIARKAAVLMDESRALTEGIYRVRLSCPVCDWLDTVVREDRASAIAEGNRRILAHTTDAGHRLSGEPHSGYFRGEPLN